MDALLDWFSYMATQSTLVIKLMAISKRNFYFPSRFALVDQFITDF